MISRRKILIGAAAAVAAAFARRSSSVVAVASQPATRVEFQVPAGACDCQTLNTRFSVVEGIKDAFMASPVVVVFDHFARAQASPGIAQPGFGVVLDLLRAGRAYVKVSAPYNSSAMAPDYPDVSPLPKALIAANPQRILRGTNWPHPPDTSQRSRRSATVVSPLRETDDGRVFNLFADWAPDAAQRRTILVDNPARLYGF